MTFVNTEVEAILCKKPCIRPPISSQYGTHVCLVAIFLLNLFTSEKRNNSKYFGIVVFNDEHSTQYGRLLQSLKTMFYFHLGSSTTVLSEDMQTYTYNNEKN